MACADWIHSKATRNLLRALETRCLCVCMCVHTRRSGGCACFLLWVIVAELNLAALTVTDRYWAATCCGPSGKHAGILCWQDMCDGMKDGFYWCRKKGCGDSAMDSSKNRRRNEVCLKAFERFHWTWQHQWAEIYLICKEYQKSLWHEDNWLEKKYLHMYGEKKKSVCIFCSLPINGWYCETTSCILLCACHF